MHDRASKDGALSVLSGGTGRVNALRMRLVTERPLGGAVDAGRSAEQHEEGQQAVGRQIDSELTWWRLTKRRKTSSLRMCMGNT